ncbi:MAG: zincin-like metallopeptidase domain-containing protein [Capsulimonadaceae bacterium]|nr:zincin-like metallopeptidase domain-containing protein [Capsulimonadaceae bacterium]
MGLFDDITKRIIDDLDKNACVPWRRMWGGNRRPGNGAPVNGLTLRPYRGVNRLILQSADFGENRWLTFHQIKSLNGSVRKESKGTPVMYWRFPEDSETDDDGAKTERAGHPLAIRYIVFNVEQCVRLERLPAFEPVAPQTDDEAFAAAQAIVDGMPNPPVIKHGGDIACYIPSLDEVRMPKSFASLHEYYSVLYHELGHATGSEKRLARPGVIGQASYKDDLYSFEELVAQIASMFLGEEAGIKPDWKNEVSYIESWRRQLTKDHSLIVRAASHAQKAADLVLNRIP